MTSRLLAQYATLGRGGVFALNSALVIWVTSVFLFAGGAPAFLGGATDSNGATPSLAFDAVEKSMGEVSRVSFNLTLVVGWNLISIPLVDHGYRASTLPLTKLDAIYRWDTENQSYDPVYVYGVSPPSVDFAIEGGTGYWIYTKVAQTLHLNGSIPTTTQSRTIVVPSTYGFAFIGFAFSNWYGKHASDIPLLFNGTIKTILKWNSLSKTWSIYIKGLPPSDFPLLPGEGYVIQCTSGTLVYGP